MNVTVVGAGKMGLPLACQFAKNGAKVKLLDIASNIVELINSGKAPFEEPGLDDLLSQLRRDRKIEASTDAKYSLSEAEAIVVIVPAKLDENNQVDLFNILSVTESITKYSQFRGVIISYETTLPVGTTRDKLLPFFQKSGLVLNSDFYLCFSPERVKSRKVFKHLETNPKIVGGVSDDSIERGANFYEKYLNAPVITASSSEEAEFIKLAGMIYRDVNIALANQLANYSIAMGLDITKVIEASNTDGESFILKPGIGVGGHCTPVYPYFLINQSNQISFDQSLAKLARSINEFQPQYYLDQAKHLLGTLKDCRVHILGLGFRPNIKEDTLSPAYKLVELLKIEEANVTLEDPLYSNQELTERGFSTNSGQQIELLILNTAHKDYLNIDFSKWKDRGVKVFLDGRNAIDPTLVTSNGIKYLGIGRL